MSIKTSIEWTDTIWNPIRGCSRVSEGCRHCYAETVGNRFKGPGLPYEGLIATSGQWNNEIRVVEHLMDQPLRWRKPARIFVNSMSDLFHGKVDDYTIRRVFDVMAQCPQHTFQILTKRPERMARLLSMWESVGITGEHFYGKPLANVWLGVSAECQDTFDERTRWLLRTPAAVRWVSLEPLLSAVDCEFHEIDIALEPDGSGSTAVLGGLDWVVVGGESGPHARPMDSNWVKSIRDQCQNAGVAFFFKQWGGNNKKQTGRELDGREWNEFPR